MSGRIVTLRRQLAERLIGGEPRPGFAGTVAALRRQIAAIEGCA